MLYRSRRRFATSLTSTRPLMVLSFFGYCYHQHERLCLIQCVTRFFTHCRRTQPEKRRAQRRAQSRCLPHPQRRRPLLQGCDARGKQERSKGASWRFHFRGKGPCARSGKDHQVCVWGAIRGNRGRHIADYRGAQTAGRTHKGDQRNGASCAQEEFHYV